jgi:hypothetical protein
MHRLVASAIIYAFTAFVVLSAFDPAAADPPKVSPPTGADIQEYRQWIGVSETQTVALGRADFEVSGKAAPFNGQLFPDAAPRVRSEADMPKQKPGDIESPAKDIRGQKHAEQGVLNKVLDAIKKNYPDLTPVEVNGVKTYPQIKGIFYIHQSNPSGICPTCIQGITNPKTEPGIFLQASRMLPNVHIVASTEVVPGVPAAPGSRLAFTLRNGEYVTQVLGGPGPRGPPSGGPGGGGPSNGPQGGGPRGNSPTAGSPAPSAKPLLAPSQEIRGSFVPTQRARVDAVMSRYGSIPGGVLLEGDLPGFGAITSARYDSAEGKFIINERKSYTPGITAEAAAALCRAIHKDDRVGVSAPFPSRPFIYGSLPSDSRVARDLMLADVFLGEIGFATPRWSTGYKFFNGFLPRRQSGDPAIVFTVTDYRTREEADQVFVTSVAFNAMFVPISPASAGGNLLPNVEALNNPNLQNGEFSRNVKHIADHITYYRQEKILDLAFRYGEFAAFARTLKNAKVDLARLADSIRQ